MSKVKLITPFIKLALALIILTAPFLAYADDLADTKAAWGTPPTGVTQEQWVRCHNFYKKFEINQSTVTSSPNTGSFNEQETVKNTPNFVSGIPVFCSAQQILLKVVNLLMALAAGVALVFIIIGGYQYMVSGGSEETAEKGRKTLTNAVLGLVIIIMSYSIIRIVTGALTGNVGSGTNPTSTTNTSNQTNTTPSTPSQPNPDATKIVTALSSGNAEYVTPYNLSLSVPGGTASQYCGEDPTPEAFVKVTDFSGKTVNTDSVSFTAPASNERTTLNFTLPSPKDLGFPITPVNKSSYQLNYSLYLCGSPDVYKGSVDINAPVGSNDLAEVASQMDFSWEWDLSNLEKYPSGSPDATYDLVIYLNATTEQINSVCSVKAANQPKTITVRANNEIIGSDTLPLVSNQTSIIYHKAPTKNLNVKVDVCDRQIGASGGQTVTPPPINTR